MISVSEVGAWEGLLSYAAAYLRTARWFLEGVGLLHIPPSVGSVCSRVWNLLLPITLGAGTCLAPVAKVSSTTTDAHLSAAESTLGFRPFYAAVF